MPVFRNGKRSSPFVSPPSITITGMPGRGFENRQGGTHVAFGERRDDVVAIVETGAEEVPQRRSTRNLYSPYQ